MLIDAHSHLDRYDLVDEEAAQAALDEIEEHRIFTISNSMGLSSFERNLELARERDLVLPIFGVHPWQAPEYAGRLDDLAEAVERSPMLGEIGLDFYFIEDADQYPAQRQVFQFFLQAARDGDKIVHLHTKAAEQAVLDLLDQYGIQRAVVHWYSGPLDLLDDFVARGAYVTVGLEVVYSEHIRAIARRIPAGQLLTETDNPGGPKGYVGGPGMPVLIKQVVQGVAEARGTSDQEIVRTVQANLLRLFRGDDRLEPYARVLEKEFGA